MTETAVITEDLIRSLADVGTQKISRDEGTTRLGFALKQMSQISDARAKDDVDREYWRAVARTANLYGY